MGVMKLLLDTNIVIDYLNEREPFYEKARLLMIAGRVGEFELWVSSSQMTDIIYILSDGGKPSLMPQVLELLRGLRTFVEVFPVSGQEIDKMLVAAWKDPEDCLLVEIALKMRADAIITRNQKDFETNLVRVMDCEEFFSWLKSSYGLDYEEVAL